MALACMSFGKLPKLNLKICNTCREHFAADTQCLCALNNPHSLRCSCFPLFSVCRYGFNFPESLSATQLKKKKKNVLHVRYENASHKRRFSSFCSGMSGSVYVTQLMTLYGVSLKGCRKSCAFMRFLDKPRWGFWAGACT